MAKLVTKSELNEAIRYRLECIAGFSANIQTAMQDGLDLSDRFDEIDKVDTMFAYLSDLADDYARDKYDVKDN